MMIVVQWWQMYIICEVWIVCTCTEYLCLIYLAYVGPSVMSKPSIQQWFVFQAILSVHKSLVLSSLTTTTCSHSQLLEFLARHKRSLVGDNYYTNLSPEETILFRNTRLLEIVLMVSLYFWRRFVLLAVLLCSLCQICCYIIFYVSEKLNKYITYIYIYKYIYICI